jgi:hypothetical protein
MIILLEIEIMNFKKYIYQFCSSVLRSQIVTLQTLGSRPDTTIIVPFFWAMILLLIGPKSMISERMRLTP